MTFKNDDGLFRVFRAAGKRFLNRKQTVAAFRVATGKRISGDTVRRFIGRHVGRFERLTGTKYRLRENQSNVIPFEPKGNEMSISKVQKFVFDGYRKYATETAMKVDDLDKLLRQEDPENLLGPIEKRRCNHATTKLRKLGLIEHCGKVGNPGSNGSVGLYKISTPKPEPVAAQQAHADPVEPAPVPKRGGVIKMGECIYQTSPDDSPEFVAELMKRLSATG